MVGKQNPKTCPYDELYGLLYEGRKFMKLFLDETKHLGLSNHKNYETLDLKWESYEFLK